MTIRSAEVGPAVAFERNGDAVAPVSSRLPQFYAVGVAERRRRLAAAVPTLADELAGLDAAGLSLEAADAMAENVITTCALPLGVALNFLVNGRDRFVPMVVEEPSVIAAASNAALVARAGGGFVAESERGGMIGQIQLLGVPDPEAACRRLEAAAPSLLAHVAEITPSLRARGGGPRGLEVRLVPALGGEPMVVVHVLLDTVDAMGANHVNRVVERLAPQVEAITEGTACLRIVSNLADRRLARARVRIPLPALARSGFTGEEVAARIVWAYELAAVDPYRAATHNKGIMNGVDAVALATGNDWRAIEAGAHAYACRNGTYGSLSTWTIDDGALLGSLELPMAVSTVGPAVRTHPTVGFALRLLQASDAQDLAGVMVAAGLASNLAALRALATEGIQRGHMALHARGVSFATRALDLGGSP